MHSCSVGLLLGCSQLSHEQNWFLAGSSLFLILNDSFFHPIEQKTTRTSTLHHQLITSTQQTQLKFRMRQRKS